MPFIFQLQNPFSSINCRTVYPPAFHGKSAFVIDSFFLYIPEARFIVVTLESGIGRLSIANFPAGFPLKGSQYRAFQPVFIIEHHIICLKCSVFGPEAVLLQIGKNIIPLQSGRLPVNRTFIPNPDSTAQHIGTVGSPDGGRVKTCFKFQADLLKFHHRAGNAWQANRNLLVFFLNNSTFIVGSGRRLFLIPVIKSLGSHRSFGRGIQLNAGIRTYPIETQFFRPGNFQLIKTIVVKQVVFEVEKKVSNGFECWLGRHVHNNPVIGLNQLQDGIRWDLPFGGQDQNVHYPLKVGRDLVLLFQHRIKKKHAGFFLFFIQTSPESIEFGNRYSHIVQLRPVHEFRKL